MTGFHANSRHQPVGKWPCLPREDCSALVHYVPSASCAGCTDSGDNRAREVAGMLTGSVHMARAETACLGDWQAELSTSERGGGSHWGTEARELL